MPLKRNTIKFEYNITVPLQIIFVWLGLPFLVFLDSPWLSHYFLYGQDTVNAIMVFFYSWFLLGAKPRLRWLILLMTTVSFFAEIFGSLILGLYQYHLKNIPMYIPLGHAVMYATVYQFCRRPLIWRYHTAIEKSLQRLAFITSFMSLVLLKDAAGFICYILFLIILYRRKKPLFYLSMFIMVYYLEFLGTAFSAWSWYSVLGNHPYFPPIAYTPSGIAGLYMLIDITTNAAYFYGKKIKKFLYNLATGPTLNLKSNTRYFLLKRTIHKL
ncbi:hypothetical protein [Legionella nagasakiensis]|uniref:hypothetical protein n=1 Tax=Legionella nagasakiensis TaxID=535290 RepID=UPI001054346D|nr:hypothetical protein [Legionella nagasakiensis]